METVDKLVLLYKLQHHVAYPSNEIVEVSEIVLWGNLDNTLCQAPEVSTNMYVHVCSIVCTKFITCTYTSVLIFDIYVFFQHAHIENVKTVTNLSNNKDALCVSCVSCLCWLPAAL